MLTFREGFRLSIWVLTGLNSADDSHLGVYKVCLPLLLFWADFCRDIRSYFLVAVATPLDKVTYLIYLLLNTKYTTLIFHGLFLKRAMLTDRKPMEVPSSL